MKYIDMHCDTVMYAYFHDLEDCFQTEGMCDVQKLKEGQALLQFLGIFLPPATYGDWEKFGKRGVSDHDYMDACRKIFQNTMERYADVIAPVRTAADVLECDRQGKIGALLSVEEGRDIQGSMERLREYYDWGVRLLTLTWNYKNCFGSPNSDDPKVMAEGLTDFGKDAVIQMGELGMLVDVSHLSDGGFWDVAKISKKPFVASHSNCRALSPHRRNMTDDMIRKMAECGGVMGLNFVPYFLDSKCREEAIGTIDLLTAHVRHMVNTGGIECAAIGTDFDGFDGNTEIAGPQQMQKLFWGLHKAGFSDDAIEKIAWKNTFRVMTDVL